MRIHFYGVQGSGSVFPSKAERAQSREQADMHLLEQIFQRMQDNTNVDGKLA